MKALLVIAIALTTVTTAATAPAFAASRGYYGNENVNRGDYQLSGARWKTNKHHKAHRTSK